MSNYYRPGRFGGFSFFPPVIKNLMIINGVIFLLDLIGNMIKLDDGMTLSMVMLKYFALWPLGTPYFYPWQFISYQFMHGGFGHIAYNMFALWMFGMELENIWGPKKFLIFYLIAGVFAGLLHFILTPLLGGVLAPTVGASGAIYGIMVAFAMMFPDREIYLYFFIPVKVKYFVVFMVIMDFMFIGSAGSTVAHLAHLGGALAGFVIVILERKGMIDFNKFFTRKPKSFNYKKQGEPFKGFGMSNPFRKSEDVQDAKYYDMNEKDEISQERVDEILDKLFRVGYKNLSSEEKRILDEASKKMK